MTYTERKSNVQNLCQAESLAKHAAGLITTQKILKSNDLVQIVAERANDLEMGIYLEAKRLKIEAKEKFISLSPDFQDAVNIFCSSSPKPLCTTDIPVEGLESMQNYECLKYDNPNMLVTEPLEPGARALLCRLEVEPDICILGLELSNYPLCGIFVE